MTYLICRPIIIVALLFVVLSSAIAQKETVHTMEPPLRIPLFLSGNFAELRANHFHSGIDIKTQGVEGKPVYAVDGGYVARVSVSIYGFGLAIYINHPSGLTSVYAHLNRFAAPIDSAVRSIQYKQEQYNIDYTFQPNAIPIAKGKIIAFSGNSGSSGGPHLHFELRHTTAETPIDPLPFYRQYIADTIPPLINQIAIYPIQGVVNARHSGRVLVATTLKQRGNYGIATPLPKVWGKIALGIKAFDMMNGVSNKFGVHKVTLSVDNEIVFSSQVGVFRFDQSRYINSLIDYTAAIEQRSYIMRSLIDPGNNLPFYSTHIDRGVITVNKERLYRCCYTLCDMYGNKSELHFDLQGESQPLSPKIQSSNELHFVYNIPHYYHKNGLQVDIPIGSLYKDIDFKHQSVVSPSQLAFSQRHTIHTPSEPLHSYIPIKIEITNDTVSDKDDYYLCEITPKGEKTIFGLYNEGRYSAKIRNFGTFEVRRDSYPPVITPQSPDKWGARGIVSWRITDKLTGIKSYKGTINGQFVLFVPNNNGTIVSYKIDKTQFSHGTPLRIRMEAVDMCGNRAEQEEKIKW